MSHPDEDPDLPGAPRRRPSHFRKKRRDTRRRVARVVVDRPSSRPASEIDVSHVVRKPGPRQEQWSEVINPAPALPDPVLHRAVPPPAPLPSDADVAEPASPTWLDDRQRRKKVEDIVGTVGLAIMVAAMVTAMWLRMIGP